MSELKFIAFLIWFTGCNKILESQKKYVRIEFTNSFLNRLKDIVILFDRETSVLTQRQIRGFFFLSNLLRVRSPDLYILSNWKIFTYFISGVRQEYNMDVVEWSRALDVRLSEWCCSVSMVWVQIPSREEQKFDSSKI